MLLGVRRLVKHENHSYVASTAKSVARSAMSQIDYDPFNPMQPCFSF